MKHINYITYLFIIYAGLCYGQSNINVALFNFNNSSVDQNNELAVELSEKISRSFINTMKDDMSFLSDEVNFIPTKDLDKELKEVRKILLKSIESDLQEGITNFVSRERLFDMINKASRRTLNDSQVKSLADSLIYSIADVTKDITKDMMLSNVITSGEPSKITIGDLYNFINNITKESLIQSSFSSLISSARKDFKTDIIVTGKYSIIENEVRISLFIYNFSDFKLINTISSRSPLNKGNVLIKDLEFKLLAQIGVALDDPQKAELCRYDVSKFSKEDDMLYFTDIFQADDVIELKYRLQFNSNFDLVSYHYYSFFRGLMEMNIPYKVKFYNDDTLYRIYSTESVTETAAQVDVLRNNWSEEIHIGKLHSSQNINLAKSNPKKSKMVVGINFNTIEAVYFKSEQDTSSILKQIFALTFIIGSGFLLSLLL